MYNVKIIPRAQKDIDKLRGKLFNDIEDEINRLKDNPRPPGCEKLTDEEGYRVRVRDYRILYRINDKSKIVFIHRVRHREEVYRQF